MTLGDLATQARFLTNTDTTSYPDANLLFNINVWYQKIVSMILESQDESDFDDARNTTYPIKTTPLVSGQRDYSIPVSEKVLKIKRIDISYDGTNYYRATPVDDGAVVYDMGANASITDNNFVKQAPYYDIKYNSVFIYPAPTSADTSGFVRIEWERNITPFVVGDYTSVLTDSTVIPGYDDPFHPMLAEGAALEHSIARQLPQYQQLQSSITDWEIRLRQHYGKKELDREYALTPVYDDNYGR